MERTRVALLVQSDLEDALQKVDIALILTGQEHKGYANILDTKAEVLWKMGNIKDAVLIIEEALKIDSDSEYYQSQKEKFLQSAD